MANRNPLFERSTGRKVCHAFSGTEGGRWVYEQLAALKADHGCDVTIVLGGETGTTVERSKELGIPVKAFDFDLSNPRKVLGAAFRVLRLAWWMRSQRFEVVQSHVLSTSIFVRPAAWLADVPVRLTMVTGPYYMQAPAYRALEVDTMWMETGIVPSCELSARLYREEYAAPPVEQVLYYGPDPSRWDPAAARPVDLRKEFGLGEDALLIGCVAIFYPKCGTTDFYPPETRDRHIKGQDDLIRAMPAILKDFPQARLVFFGKGWSGGGEEAEIEIRNLAEQMGLKDKVIFAGYRNDIADVYCELDVSVQASHNENLGGTVESLLMETPTVATRVGGMVDAIIDAQTGLLAQPGNPQDLAAKITAMLADPQKARGMGRAGRQMMLERFCLDTTAAGLSELYHRQLATARGRWRLRTMIYRMGVASAHFFPIFIRMMKPRYSAVLRGRTLWLARKIGRQFVKAYRLITFAGTPPTR